MKKKIKTFISHPLFSGSLVMVIGTNLANFFAMIYHFIIGRLLSVNEYGDLAAMVALVGFGISLFSFLNIVIPKFVSSAKDEKEVSEIISWFLQKTLIIGTCMLIVVLILSPLLSQFFHVSNTIIYLIGPIFVTSLLTLVLRASLQGILRFFSTAVSNNIEMLGRVVFGSLFVVLGLKVFGGILGILIANIITVLMLVLVLKKYIKKFKGDLNIRNELIKYSLPALFYSIAITSFISIDVILAKHFLDSFNAGLYSSLSILGKIVLYGSSPVGLVMFPLISKKHSKGEDYTKIFLLSFMLIVGVSIIGVAFFSLFPKLIIGFLYGTKYIVSAGNLFWFSLYAAILGIVSLVSSFFMSINKTKVGVITFVFAMSQIVGVWFIHGSILEIIKVSIVCVSLLLLTLLTYVGHEIRRGNAK